MPNRSAFVWLTAVLLLAGCDPEWMKAEPGVVCTSAGEQCRLSEGPLGVCERAPCAAGEAGPCFACTPQH